MAVKAQATGRTAQERTMMQKVALEEHFEAPGIEREDYGVIR
jgi:hypothetical protein